MTIEKLQNDMIASRKAGDVFRKNVLANMIDAVNKASITNKGRIEITEELTNEALIKYQKVIQEQIDTCPLTGAYTERRNAYIAELAVVKAYAPQLITDTTVLKQLISDICTKNSLDLVKTNRGIIMKTVMPLLKSTADLNITSKVISEMLV